MASSDRPLSQDGWCGHRHSYGVCRGAYRVLESRSRFRDRVAPTHSAMPKSYLYALASVQRFGSDERDRLRYVGVVPTFTLDCDRGFDDPGTVSLRFDTDTEFEAESRLQRALGAEAHLQSTCQTVLPELDGINA